MPPGRGGHLPTELPTVESAGQPTPDVPILSLSGGSSAIDPPKIIILTTGSGISTR
jgi:hypothetical protein